MKKILSFILIFVLSFTMLASCGANESNSAGNPTGGPTNNPPSPPEQSQTTEDESAAESIDNEKTDIPSDLPENADTLAVSYVSGTDNCWTLSGKTLTFSGLTENTVCSVTGEFDGQIIIDAGDGYKFELELCGVTLYSGEQNPVSILSGDKVTLTAKKGSKNYVYDTRDAVSDTTSDGTTSGDATSSDTTSVSSAIYSVCDLDLGGKGELIVISANNNGIHGKKDLDMKNLTLSVTCADNALKGNDSVDITGGVITLVAKSGDGIKTTDTDVSSKGNQRGTVSISGGTVNIYAACDGIDAAYNAEISGDAVINVYTDRYSPYSEDVESAETDSRYIRAASDAYKYSVKYINGDDYKFVNATLSKTVNGGRSNYYYYSFEKLDGYDSIQVFVYSSSQEQGQEDDYTVKTDTISWNDSYDTFAIESRGGRFTYNWTNYSSVDGWGGNGGNMGGGHGGQGGMQDGNSEKGDHSTKGVKADNEVIISGGVITAKSYDDAIHANSDAMLENGETATGNVTISGGTLTLYSKDDGIHADGTLTVTDGTIVITGCYEGLEGLFVNVKGGDISIVSSDDGINATTVSGIGITFESGKVYIYAGGDGVDSNSRTSYQGIVFSGGDIVIVSASGGNSSIDTEQGYTYNGGNVLAICPANGMGNESMNCRNFSSVATKTTMNLTKGQTLTVSVNGEVVSSVSMPSGLSALVIYLGSANASFSAA